MSQRILYAACIIVLLAAFLSCHSETSLNLPEGLVQITEPGAYRPAEVSVAINPENPSNIIAAFFHYGSPGKPRTQNYTYVSSDAGSTWAPVEAHNPDGRVQGDDAVTADASGRWVHSYIAFNGIRVERPEIARNGIFVQTSTDEGLTWTHPVAVVDHINTVQPFEDKPWIRADRVDESPFRDNLYVAWTHFDVYGSEAPGDSSYIHLSVSDDGGNTFSMPIRISDRGGDCVDSDNTVEGAVPAVGTNGEVFVVWAGPDGLLVDRSYDGGVTFGRDLPVSDMPGGWDIDIEGIGRANGMPVTGADLSQGPHRGRWYVNWIDQRHGDPDVFVVYSDDMGETWSEPKRVNKDPIGNGKEQFFTWMAVDPVDGSVNLAFYDRAETEGTNTKVTLARSTDGGDSFDTRDVGLEPFETNPNVFFGDYLGIDAYDGVVVAAFPHFLSEENLAVSAVIIKNGPPLPPGGP